jgi:hypothetical protein
MAYAAGIAVCDDDIGVVEQAVQQANGARVLGPEPAPLNWGAVAGDGRGGPLVPLARSS